MKKIITMFGAVMLCLSLNSSAQTTVWQEDFESATSPILPSGWSTDSTADTSWQTRSGSVSFPSSGIADMPAHTQYAMVDDWNLNKNNNPSLLITPFIDLTSITGAFLNYDYYFNGAGYGGGPRESALIEASLDSGHNWTVIDTIRGTYAGVWENAYVNLSAYNGVNNLKIAFVYFDGGSTTQKLIGCGIDNAKVFVPLQNDAMMDKVILPPFSGTDHMAASGNLVTFSYMNMGGNIITSLDVQYVIDGGTPVTQTFTGLSLAPYASSTLTFTTPLSGIIIGTHTADVTITQVNAGPDANPADNHASTSFFGASKSVTRAGLIEEFSSSTCVPCAGFNATFDPLIEDNKVNDVQSNFNVIKYQMNWPSPGNDQSYNAHGVSRQGYYGVNSIPMHFTNGLEGAGGDQTEIDACKTDPAFMDINSGYNVTGDSVFANFNIVPHFTHSGSYKVYAAVIETNYTNPHATTTQSEYYAVMRRMFPSGNGVANNNWTDNTPVYYNYSTAAVSGSVAQMNYNFWTNPRNSSLLVFVQDNTNKNILQSKIVESNWPQTVPQMQAGVSRVAVYPNPANSNCFIGFDLDKSSRVSVDVLDAMGRIVYSVPAQSMTAGGHDIAINTSNLASGSYIVKLQTEKGNITQHLSVVK